MPGRNECTKTNVIYQATVTSDGGNTVETYVGSTTNFASRYYKHRTDANNPKYKTSTTLSVYIWKLKDEGKNFEVSWRIIDRAPAYNYASKQCGLCRKESFYILYRPQLSTLNKNHEVFKICKHRFSGLLRTS